MVVGDRPFSIAQGKLEKAQDHFEKTLSLDPDFFPALSDIASIYLHQNEAKQAVERVKKQIEMSPKNALFYNLLGQLYERNSETAKAEENLKKAVEIAPASSAFLLSLGNFYVRQNMVDEAIQEYQAAIEKSFDGPLEWQSLAGRRACRIRKVLPGGGLQDRELWPEIQTRMVDAMVRLEKALKPRVQRL